LVNKLQVAVAATTETPHFGCERELERLWAGIQIASIENDDFNFKSLWSPLLEMIEIHNYVYRKH
jgi:hypothetical protein